MSRSLGDPKRATAVGTNAGVTATITGAAGERLSVTGIECSGDAAAIVTIESPASTILWRQRFAGAFTVNEDFEEGEVLGASGQNVLVKVSASTLNSEANIGAKRLPG